MGEKCDQNLQDLEQHWEKEMERTWSLPSLCDGGDGGGCGGRGGCGDGGGLVMEKTTRIESC